LSKQNHEKFGLTNVEYVLCRNIYEVFTSRSQDLWFWCTTRGWCSFSAE